MLMTIRVPELNNKEFSFKDSTKNLKLVTKLMKQSFQDQVDAQTAPDEKEPDFEKMSPKEVLDYEVKNTKKQISAFNDELKRIDQTISTFAEIFGLSKEDSKILEELSTEELGSVLGHVSFRLNRPQVSEDQFWDLISAGETKKLAPEKG